MKSAFFASLVPRHVLCTAAMAASAVLGVAPAMAAVGFVDVYMTDVSVPDRSRRPANFNFRTFFEKTYYQTASNKARFECSKEYAEYGTIKPPILTSVAESPISTRWPNMGSRSNVKSSWQCIIDAGD